MADNAVDSNLLWEMIKVKTREASIEYGKTKKKVIFKKQDDVEKLIRVLDEQPACLDAKLRIPQRYVRIRKKKSGIRNYNCIPDKASFFKIQKTMLQ